jgi:hypothetical protein
LGALTVLAGIGSLVALSLAANSLLATIDKGPKPVGTTKWYLDTGVSSLTDKQRVVLSLSSDQEVSGKNPQLIVRCEDGKLSIYIDTRWGLAPEDDKDDNRRAVTYRFDKDTAVRARLSVSTGDQEAVFFDKPDLWMARLSKADSLLVEYSSLTWGRQTVRFPVAGFSEAGAAAVHACPPQH